MANKSEVRTGVSGQERKALALADARKVGDIIFDTKVNIRQVRSKMSEKWLTIITIGQDQDKVFMVTARNDGKGTCLLTDWDIYERLGSKPMLKAKV